MAINTMKYFAVGSVVNGRQMVWCFPSLHYCTIAKKQSWNQFFLRPMKHSIRHDRMTGCIVLESCPWQNEMIDTPMKERVFWCLVAQTIFFWGGVETCTFELKKKRTIPLAIVLWQFDIVWPIFTTPCPFLRVSVAPASGFQFAYICHLPVHTKIPSESQGR